MRGRSSSSLINDFEIENDLKLESNKLLQMQKDDPFTGALYKAVESHCAKK
jgi:hypothetical protein